MKKDLASALVAASNAPGTGLADATLVIARIEYPHLDPAPYLAKRLHDDWIVAAHSATALRALGAAGIAVLRGVADDKGVAGDLARQILFDVRADAQQRLLSKQAASSAGATRREHDLETPLTLAQFPADATPAAPYPSAMRSPEPT